MSPPSEDIRLVGANFAANDSLSSRYTSYLTSGLHGLTSPDTFLHTDPGCVVTATSRAGTADPLAALQGLARRHGFARCSGRLFAMERTVVGTERFFTELRRSVGDKVVLRTHLHPQNFALELLDWVEGDEECRQRAISCSPTSFSHVVVAVRMADSLIGWGVYTPAQYRSAISRPGDGDRSPVFDLNFNRAELKIAECLQLLDKATTHHLFSKPLLAVDVGASPGGWTGYLARVPQLPGSQVSVLAIDPGHLSPALLQLDTVAHLPCKAELVSADGGRLLDTEAAQLVGGDTWRGMFRLLVCDANMDIRDTLRDLVLPLAAFMSKGGVVVVTLKLGRRVGVAGVERKVAAATQLLEGAGLAGVRVEWLFGNSRNERTIIAVKT